MSRVALCSAKGSPGVTTLSCVLGAVWPSDRAVVVAECDPSGGDLAGRFGLSTRIGMTSLVLTERQGVGHVPDYRAHAQQLPGGLDVLVGPTGADSAMALDHELGMSSSEFVSDECDLLADCGRLLPGAIGQGRMIRAAENVLLLVRPDVAGIAHARWATTWIRDLSPVGASVVTVGTGMFKPAEVAEELDVDVLGAVPIDPRAAWMACGAPGSARRFVRSELVAFARELAGGLNEVAYSRRARAQGEPRRSLRSKGRESRHLVPEQMGPVRRPARPGQGQRDERSRTPSP